MALMKRQILPKINASTFTIIVAAAGLYFDA